MIMMNSLDLDGSLEQYRSLLFVGESEREVSMVDGAEECRLYT